MVQLPNGLWFGKYEVTQAQYECVMHWNVSQFRDPDNPVERIPHHECQEYLRCLRAIPAVRDSGLSFRLPTDKEWEYACRAGSRGKYCRLADGTEITENTLGQVAWFEDNSGSMTHPVGQKQPNAFGLYDMQGNVCEWVVTTGRDNCTCGGCYLNSAGGCESSFRSWEGEFSKCEPWNGFRLCADERK